MLLAADQHPIEPPAAQAADGYPDGPASPERHGARFGSVRMGSGGPAADREASTRLGARVCLDEGSYLHRQ
jgi:hypothetical protein